MSNGWDDLGLDWDNINPNDPRYNQVLNAALSERLDGGFSYQLSTVRGMALIAGTSYSGIMGALIEAQKHGRPDTNYATPSMVSTVWVDGMDLKSKFISMGLSESANLSLARGMPFESAVGAIKETKRLLQRMRYRDIPVSSCPLSTLRYPMVQKSGTLYGQPIIIGYDYNRPIYDYTQDPPVIIGYEPIYQKQNWDYNYVPPRQTNQSGSGIIAETILVLPDRDIIAKMQNLFELSNSDGKDGGIVGGTDTFQSYINRGVLSYAYPKVDEYYPSSIALSSKDDYLDVGVAGLLYRQNYINQWLLVENAKAKIWVRLHELPQSTDLVNYQYPPDLPDYTTIDEKKYLVFDAELTTRNRKSLFILPDGVIPELPSLFPRNETRRNEYRATFTLERVIIDENSIERYKYKASDDFI